MLCVVGASGKLGSATLKALLSHRLIPGSDIVCTTSSDAGTEKLESTGSRDFSIKQANWDDATSLEVAFQGCEEALVVSSSRIEKYFHDAPEGHGREADHFTALQAAQKAGVDHVYYTSLAFAAPSRAGVMKAHERTEAWPRTTASPRNWTIIRQGL